MDKGKLEQEVIKVLKTCYDPEIPVDIYELGLIYKIDINENFDLTIDMTLTSPMCPVAESLPVEVKEKLEKVEGIKSVKINLVWEPQWDQSMMSEEAKLELGIF